MNTNLVMLSDDGLNIGNAGTSAPLQSSSYGASPQPNLIWDTSNSNIEVILRNKRFIILSNIE